MDETEKFWNFGELAKALLLMALLILIGIILSFTTTAYTEAHGVTLTSLAAGNDAPGGVIIRSYAFNFTLINLTRQSNVLTPDKCYVWPNGTSYVYGTPLATGTFSGAVCTFNPYYNVTVNTTIIVAMDRILGSYNSYSQNPVGGMPGLQGNITSWMGGVYSNSAETTFTLYPTALVDVIGLGVENNTKPAPAPLSQNKLNVSLIFNSTTNESIYMEWNVTGNYSRSWIWRNSNLVYNNTLTRFNDTGLTPNTSYVYNITVSSNFTLQNSTVFTLSTLPNTVFVVPMNLTNVTMLLLEIKEELNMLGALVFMIVLFAVGIFISIFAPNPWRGIGITIVGAFFFLFPLVVPTGFISDATGAYRLKIACFSFGVVCFGLLCAYVLTLLFSDMDGKGKKPNRYDIYG